MRFADVFIRRPVFATMLIASLVVLGLFSYRGLGLDLFPNIDFPIVTVTSTLNGARVKEDIETLRGVGQVILLGGEERAINVYVDPDRLTAQGLSIGQVRSAIQQQNLELPGGRLDQTRRELVVRTMGRLERVPEFNDLIVAHAGARPLRVRDLGFAEDGTVEPRTLARLNGENAVQLVVRKQSGTNTVAVIDRVKAELARLKRALPDDIEMRVIRDQS